MIAPGALACAVAAQILAYQEGAWTQQASFLETEGAPYFDLTGLAMRSTDDGWVVGSQGTLIHYTGGHWRQVQGPTTRDLYAVTLGGAAEGWAVGDGVILHLSNSQWTVASEAPPGQWIVGTATVAG